MAKEEIAHHEQFLLLPQSFQKSSANQMHPNVSAGGKGLNLQKSNVTIPSIWWRSISPRNYQTISQQVLKIEKQNHFTHVNKLSFDIINHTTV